MAPVDPRERYDDLRITEGRETLDPNQFEEAAASEPAAVGWVVLALAFDEASRVLLIDQPWADGWLAPGGVPKPAESLSEAVVREVREETGVEITPARPHAVEDYSFVNERTEETAGWTYVVFEATAETTEIASDLGLEDEPIDDAAWFDRLPDTVYGSDLIGPVYRRCLSGGVNGEEA